MNGLDVNPSTNRAKRRTDGRKSVQISLYHKNHKKSRCSM